MGELTTLPSRDHGVWAALACENCCKYKRACVACGLCVDCHGQIERAARARAGAATTPADGALGGLR